MPQYQHERDEVKLKLYSVFSNTVGEGVRLHQQCDKYPQTYTVVRR